ncbi:MAG: hypothetical protein K6G61_12270 [Solobacterium sp.]|nr:hypothetical protein [Solobacterium sp.]
MEEMIGAAVVIAFIAVGSYAFLKWSAADDRQYVFEAEITDHWTVNGMEGSVSVDLGVHSYTELRYIVVFRRTDTGEELQFETDSEVYSYDAGTKGTLTVHRGKLKEFIPVKSEEYLGSDQ